jgi:hypothetical protein
MDDDHHELKFARARIARLERALASARRAADAEHEVAVAAQESARRAWSVGFRMHSREERRNG